MVVALRIAPRPQDPLGASPSLLVLILSNQLPSRFFGLALAPAALPLAGAVAAFTIVFLTAGSSSGPSGLRYFTAFAVIIALSGILFPYDAMQVKGQTSWPILAIGGGARYLFFLVLALALSALAAAWPRPGRHLRRLARAPAVVLVVTAAALSSFQYVYPALPAEHLDRYQGELSAATPGMLVTIPIDPREWTMVLRAAG